MAKAVALFSGGLDSTLSVKLVQRQGVEVEALHFSSIFNACDDGSVSLSILTAARSLGIPLHVMDFTADIFDLLRAPAHGFGSAANPCIDCHSRMLVRAAERMRETGADFIVTGEVAGQRPMSQRTPVLRMIERDTGLQGLILRPLSARALPVTIPEEKGLVDRERLEGITGRSRKRQMELARELGIDKYPSPAGGCSLTDPQFGTRVIDLLDHDELSEVDALLLKVGRHYRLDGSTKAVVGRNSTENQVVEALARPQDLLLTMSEVTGPSTLLRGALTIDNIETAAALTARSSRMRGAESASVDVRPGGTPPKAPQTRITRVAPAADDLADALSVGGRRR